MWRYRELKDYEPSHQTSILLTQKFSNSVNVLKDIGLTFHTGEYIRTYRRFLDTQPGYDWTVGGRNDIPYKLNHSVWKPCQSYEGRVVDFIPDNSGQGIPWVSRSTTELGWYYPVSGVIDRLVLANYRTFKDRYGAFGQHNAGLTSMVETNSGSLSFVPKPLGLTTMCEASLKTMLPHVKAELSLVNSIIELKDFKSLPRTLANLKQTTLNLASLFSAPQARKSYQGFYSLVRSSFRPEEGLTLRELLHSSADGYLQAKFNLLPLFGDICAIFRACANLSKTMNSLVQNQGRMKRKHYTYNFIPSQFTGADAIQDITLELDQFAGTELNGQTTKTGCYRKYSFSPLRVTRRTIIDEPATFHAEIEYSYHFTQYQNEHARLLTLLDSLGVNLSPAIIWNAIPWSFVIDWFIGVSRYLGERKTLNMEPAVCISRYMWSWKSTRKVRTWFAPANPFASTFGLPQCPTVYLPDLYETIYRRDVELPAISNSLYGSGFSDSELILGGALAITRAFHPRRGRRV